MLFHRLFPQLSKQAKNPSGHRKSPAWASVDDDRFIPTFTKDMPATIVCTQGGNDAVSFSAKLSFFDLNSVVIERILGTFSIPVLPQGSTVQLQGYDKKLNPVSMEATVVDSSVLQCVLSDLKPVKYASNRESARLPLMDVEGAIFDMKDSALSKPISCQVLDISPTGARIVSGNDFTIGNVFRLRVELIKGCGRISFPSQVVRKGEEKDGLAEYGLLFAQLDARKQRDLLQDMEDYRKALAKKLGST